jgi:protein-S-isoprenylcysteine O-methyltransferase Ste14
MKGKILVIIQFTCLGALLLLTGWSRLPLISVVLFSCSFGLALWAMLVMKFGNFNVVPDPVERGVMVSQGPYRLIRHPMYAAILLFALGVMEGGFSLAKLLVTLVLAADLTVKMLYEETLLCRHYPGYETYMKRTKRIIPFIW